MVVREDKKLLTVLFPDGRDGRAFTLKVICCCCQICITHDIVLCLKFFWPGKVSVVFLYTIHFFCLKYFWGILQSCLFIVICQPINGIHINW